MSTPSRSAQTAELLDGGGAEGVGGGEDDLFALLLEVAGQLGEAARYTESPCVESFAASFPIVVVFPVPLTPTTRITDGRAET